MRTALFALVTGALALGACGREGPPPAPHGHRHAHETSASPPSSDPVERALDEVARIHGAPGPWAVAGYRMGQHALARLGLSRGSLELEVVHTTPKKVQFSCIADGAGASTGASPGKLNLSVVEGKDADVVTVYRNRRTGAKVALRPSASFRARYLDVPTREPRLLGREVMRLPPEQVFEEAEEP